MTRKIKMLCFLMLAPLVVVFAQNRCRFYATVVDARSNKPVSKLSLLLLPYKQEIKTDGNGQFLLNIPEGNIQLLFNEYPFDRQEININLQKDTSIVIVLTSPFEHRHIDEVEIISDKMVNDKIASHERLDKQLFFTLPSMLGERDLIKALSLAAGVTSSGEASADMQVRGGNQGQNLYLMNNVPLYFTQHALGFMSAFNPNIVQNAELYKAGFPARYGGKISSVVTVNTIEPSLTKRNGEFEIGLISSKAFINLPLIKDKVGVYVSGRFSNFTPLLVFANMFSEKKDTHFGISFSDINAGVKYKIDERNHIKLDFFRIGDNWNIAQDDRKALTTFRKNNSQMNLSLNWTKSVNNSIENKLLLYIDDHCSMQSDQIEIVLPDDTKREKTQGYRTNITSLNISDELNWSINKMLSINSGFSYKDNMFSPLDYVIDLNANESKKKALHFHEFSLFTQSDIRLTDKQNLSIGLRVTTAFNKQLFFSLEPRLTYQIQLPNNYSMSSSLSKMTQTTHRIANSGLGLPIEIYVPSTTSFLPEKSWIYTVGGGKEIYKTKCRISLKTDFWYKQMENIVEFCDDMDAYNILLNGYDIYDENQQAITTGKGKAYGTDFSLSFHRKNTTVLVDYTWMRAINQFDKLNNGKPFNSPTDIRNSLSVTVSQKLLATLLFTANWQIRSGKPITIPSNILPQPTIDFSNNTVSLSETQFIFLYNERNNFRITPFHKLDISITQNFLIKKRYQSSFSVGLYNAYNQANFFLYTLSVKETRENGYVSQLNSVSIFPIVPFISFSTKF